jgi:hypothetical protein
MFVVGKGIGPPLSKSSSAIWPFCRNRAVLKKAVAFAQRVALAHIVKAVAIAQHLEKLSQSRSVSQSRTS